MIDILVEKGQKSTLCLVLIYSVTYIIVTCCICTVYPFNNVKGENDNSSRYFVSYMYIYLLREEWFS